MKKLYFLFMLLFTVSISYSQIEMQVLDEAAFEGIDLSNPYLDLPVHILLTNTSTETLEVKWTIAPSDDSCVAEWTYLGCDDTQCYLEGVLTNINPPGEGPNVPSVMDPGESYEFIFHLRPNSTPGCCDIELQISLVSDPETILNSVMMPVTVNDAACTTATNDYIESDLNIYPNPFSTTLNFESDRVLRNISIQNIQGQEVFESQNLNSNSISINPQINTGFYILNLVDIDGNQLKPVKIFKQ